MTSINMIDNPLIGIVVPAFNGEKRILTCLESISKRPYKNFEVKSSLQSEGSRSFFVLLFKS